MNTRNLGLLLLVPSIAFATGCKSKGVCVYEEKNGELCSGDTDTRFCDSMKGTFHDYPSGADTSYPAGKSAAIRDACKTAGFTTAIGARLYSK